MALVTLQFSRCDDFGSDAIRLFEHGGTWSHVDSVTDSGTFLGARDDVCAGIPSGVQIRPKNYHDFSKVKLVGLACTDAQRALYDAFLIAQLGKPYDETAIIGLALDRDWRNPESWYCVELILAALESAGILPFPISLPCNRSTPDDGYLVCSVLTDVGVS